MQQPQPERLSRGNYIQGQFIKVEDPNGEVESRNPGNLAMDPRPFPFCFEHIPEAVEAARRGLPAWRRLAPAARLQAVQRYRELLAAKADTLAWHLAFEVGKPLWEARLEVADTLGLIDFFVEQYTATPPELRMEEAGQIGVVRQHPRGAMAVIPPAAQPVIGAHAHFVPALLSGNTIVMKSTKNAPMTGQYVAELCHESGMPAGVFNVLQGDSEVARRLCAEPEIDGIFFTGHHETAFKIKKAILSDYWKMLVMESGGRNSVVVWNDCDYRRALADTVLGAFVSTGQRCMTSNRILVHEKIFDRFLEDFHLLAKKCRIGHGLVEGDNAPFMGPLLSEASLENYLRYQGIAVREGCEEVMRGKMLERGEKGYYVSPSIHVVHRADPKSVYQKNEVIGPNVAVYRVQDLEETIELLNQPQLGLAGAAYTGAREVYLRLAEEARVGVFHWNRPTVAPAYRLAYAGLKRSGNARPMGRFSFQQCTYPISSWEATEAAPAYPAAMPLPEKEKSE